MSSGDIFMNGMVVVIFNEKSQVVKLFFFLHLSIEIANYFFLVFKSHSAAVDKCLLEIATVVATAFLEEMNRKPQ